MIYIFHLDGERLVDCWNVPSKGSYISSPSTLTKCCGYGGSYIMKLERSCWRTSLREDRTVIKASINLQNAAVLYVCTRFLCWNPILQLADSVNASHSMAGFICQSRYLPASSGLYWICYPIAILICLCAVNHSTDVTFHRTRVVAN